MTSPIQVFDRKLLRLRRERAAADIGGFDFLLTDVASRLADRLDLIKKEFPTVVDLGGHGVMARALAGRAGIETVVTADVSRSMAAQAAQAALGVVADEEFLPFKTCSLDAVISNLSLHWVNDLPGAMVQIRQALKPDGLFLAAVLGGESLYELRESLMTAELAVTGGASPRVSPFIDARDMGALLQRAQFALPVVDSDIITVDYSNPLKLMQDLRGMGATNAIANRLKKPTRRGVIFEAAKIYTEKFGDAKGRVPATFQIIYAIGWSPHASQQKPIQPGSAKVKLADALGVEEVKTGEKARP
ncbi:MAG TPA: methyltransferase domain-containing protein [Patescibacteria group bacterium]|nr:methyltransferase domain-containing protein [Patescibacteria group bacterium]